MYCEIPSGNRKKLFCFINEVSFAAYEALFQFDGVHWSNHGYDVFYPLLEEALLKLIQK